MKSDTLFTIIDLGRSKVRLSVIDKNKKSPAKLFNLKAFKQLKEFSFLNIFKATRVLRRDSSYSYPYPRRK